MSSTNKKFRYVDEYMKMVIEMIKNIRKTEIEKMKKASELMAKAIAKDKLINVFGSGGHSNMATQEVFHRAGGFACTNPIFVDGITIPHVPMAERVIGYAKEVFKFYNLKKGDILIIVNAYGINPITIDSALLCKKMGITTIGITGTEYPKHLPPDFEGRHPSGKNLHELVDVFIDNYLPYGDSAVKMKGSKAKIGSLSTYANAFILNSLEVMASEILIKKGMEPPIICSINTIGGEKRNDKLYKKYRVHAGVRFL